MSHNESLQEWLAENAVQKNYGEFDGIREMSLAELGALQVLTQAAIQEKLVNIQKE